jgi:hypothetical protein
MLKDWKCCLSGDTRSPRFAGQTPSYFDFRVMGIRGDQKNPPKELGRVASIPDCPIAHSRWIRGERAGLNEVPMPLAVTPRAVHEMRYLWVAIHGQTLVGIQQRAGTKDQASGFEGGLHL